MNSLPARQVNVIDADPDAGENEETVTLKIAARVQPVPPENDSGTPFTLVEVATATASIDDSSKERPRTAWPIRANGIQETGQTGNTDPPDPKAVA